MLGRVARWSVAHAEQPVRVRVRQVPLQPAARAFQQQTAQPLALQSPRPSTRASSSGHVRQWQPPLPSLLFFAARRIVAALMDSLKYIFETAIEAQPQLST